MITETKPKLNGDRLTKLLSHLIDRSALEQIKLNGSLPPQSQNALRLLHAELERHSVSPARLDIKEKRDQTTPEGPSAEKKLEYVLRRMPRRLKKICEENWGLIDRRAELDELIRRKYGRRRNGLPPYAKEWVVIHTRMRPGEWYRWRALHHQIPQSILDRLRMLPDRSPTRARWKSDQITWALHKRASGWSPLRIELELNRAPGAFSRMNQNLKRSSIRLRPQKK